jgi:hypothetical protein
MISHLSKSTVKYFLTQVEPLHLFRVSAGHKLCWSNRHATSKVNAMTEYQKIAIGLLGLTHPEIFLSARNTTQGPGQPASSTRPALERQATLERQPILKWRPFFGAMGASALVRAIKFAFAALLTGSRAVPLGDNGQLIRELGAYGARLQRFTSHTDGHTLPGRPAI